MDQYWSPDDEIGVDRQLTSSAFDRYQSRLKRSPASPIRDHIEIRSWPGILTGILEHIRAHGVIALAGRVVGDVLGIWDVPSKNIRHLGRYKS